MQAPDQLYVSTREAEQALWFLGTLTQVKATGEQTGGAYSLIEHVIPPGSASPWMEKLMVVATKYHMDILGPLPE